MVTESVTVEVEDTYLAGRAGGTGWVSVGLTGCAGPHKKYYHIIVQYDTFGR